MVVVRGDNKLLGDSFVGVRALFLGAVAVGLWKNENFKIYRVKSLEAKWIFRNLGRLNKKAIRWVAYDVCFHRGQQVRAWKMLVIDVGGCGHDRQLLPGGAAVASSRGR